MLVLVSVCCGVFLLFHKPTSNQKKMDLFGDKDHLLDAGKGGMYSVHTWIALASHRGYKPWSWVPVSSLTSSHFDFFLVAGSLGSLSPFAYALVTRFTNIAASKRSEVWGSVRAFRLPPDREIGFGSVVRASGRGEAA